MCGGNKCGPLCNNTSHLCDVTGIKNLYPLGGSPNLITPVQGEDVCLTSADPNCPPNCCNNEICMRLYDNTGNRVRIEEEIMLVFGGLTYLETVINGTNVNDGCDRIILNLIDSLGSK